MMRFTKYDYLRFYIGFRKDLFDITFFLCLIFLCLFVFVVDTNLFAAFIIIILYTVITLFGAWRFRKLNNKLDKLEKQNGSKRKTKK